MGWKTSVWSRLPNKYLTLEERAEVRRLYRLRRDESGDKYTLSRLAKKYDVSVTQISNVLKS